MPSHDLITSTPDGAAEGTHLDEHRRVCRVVDELIDELACHPRVVA